MSRTLLMLSGGIDSAAAAYHLLRAGHQLHVHHIDLVNWEGRSPHERKAVASVVSWLRREKLANFRYTTSRFDYGDLRYIVKDRAVWSFVAGIILADPKNADIDAMAIPRHRDSYRFTGQESAEQMEAGRLKANEHLASVIGAVSGRVPEFIEPVGHMTKAEIIASIPPKLLRACWWCRQPVASKPCRTRCYTCRQVTAALEALLPA